MLIFSRHCQKSHLIQDLVGFAKNACIEVDTSLLWLWEIPVEGILSVQHKHAA